jgi:hypothetical protein
MKSICIYISSLLVLFSANTFAGDDKPADEGYRFGGACTIRGPWTEQASKISRSIKTALDQLAQSCADINKDFSTLIEPQALGPVGGQSSPTDPKVGEVQNINLNDLTMSAISGTQQSSSLPTAQLSNLLGALVDKSTWGLEFGKVLDPQARQRFINSGLTSVNNLINILPKYQQCLMNQPQLGTKIISGTIKLLSVFSSSNEGTLSGVGSTIDNLVKVLNESKFVSAQSKLDNAELTMSISCLLESASHQYCSALDAIELQKLAQKQVRSQAYANALNSRSGSPMEGYIILTRETNLISQWLQKVMYGVEPRNSSDSSRKEGILNNITNFLITEARIQGKMGDFRLTYATTPDLQSKKNLLLELVSYLTGTLMNNVDAFAQTTNNENFYTKIRNTKIQMFFYLLNIPVPEVFIPKDGSQGFTGGDPSEYVSKGGKFIEIFDNPDNLLSTIDSQLKELHASAKANASAYFQNQLIVDKANLVDKAILKQTVSVYESFQHIDQYLTRLIDRIVATPSGNNAFAEIGLLPDMMQTREAVRKVMTAFEKQFNDVNADLQRLRGASAQERASLRAQFESSMLSPKYVDNVQNIISEVLVNFNLIQQRDTYLLNRLSTFVSYDYSYYTQHPELLSQYQHDLLVVSSATLLDDLAKAYKQNPAEVQQDLASAQVINLHNLRAIEYMFRDVTLANIRRLKDISDAKGDGFWTQKWSSIKQRVWDTRDQNQIKRDSILALDGRTKITSRRVLEIVNPLSLFLKEIRFFYNSYMKSDRYMVIGPTFRQAPIQMDDANHSFEQLKSRFCMQTLQLTNYFDYFDLCQNSVLNAWQSNSGPAATAALNANYNEYYRAYITAAEAARANRSDKAKLEVQQKQYDKNVCVLRDYLRKNYVEWLTQAAGASTTDDSSAETDSYL